MALHASTNKMLSSAIYVLKVPRLWNTGMKVDRYVEQFVRVVFRLKVAVSSRFKCSFLWFVMTEVRCGALERLLNDLLFYQRNPRGESQPIGGLPSGFNDFRFPRCKANFKYSGLLQD